MKKTLFALGLSFGFSLPALALTQTIRVIDVNTNGRDAVVAVNYTERWNVELDVGCPLRRYWGYDVWGSYSHDLSSRDAQLILPNGKRCVVWSAEKID